MKIKLAFLVGNFAARFTTTLMGFMLLKIYGIEVVGVFLYMLGIVGLLVPASEFGMGQTFLVESVKKRYSISSLLLVKVVFSLILLLIMLMLSYLFFEISEPLVLIMMLSINFICINAIATFYIAETNYLKSAGIRFFSAMLAVFVIIFCWSLDMAYEGFLFLYVFISFFYVAFFLSPVLIQGYLRMCGDFKKLANVLIENCYKFFASSMTLALSASLPVVAMQSLAEPKELGEFAVAVRIIAIFFSIYSIISQIAFFELLKYKDSFKRLLIQILSFLVIGILGYISISFFPSSVFITLFSVSEENSVNIDKILQSLKYILLLQAVNLPLGQYLASQKLIGLRLISQIFSISLVVIYLYFTYDKITLAWPQIVWAMLANELLVLFLLLIFTTSFILKDRVARINY